MSMAFSQSLKAFETGPGETGMLYSLPALEECGLGAISRLPVSLRILLESVLRNLDGKEIREDHVRALAGWKPGALRTEEIPFTVARVLTHDLTGIPILADFAAMRDLAREMGKEPSVVRPTVPVDLVVDHSHQVDHYGSASALSLNMEREFARNQERYRFLKWGVHAFDSIRFIPPGIGIVHQVNLEYLAPGVWAKDGIYYPDTLVGTDSHMPMINGIGVVGWGVGGIEAQAAMLGQPVYLLMPDVVGVHLSGRLSTGVTATDLVLTVTELLRHAKVANKFVEFWGEGAASLSVPDRATVANMAPEYGATIGFFPPDERTCDYFESLGRSETNITAFRNYFKAQGMFGMPRPGDCNYSVVIELDLSTVVPSVAGPRRPQDRIELAAVKEKFAEFVQRSAAPGSHKKAADSSSSRIQSDNGPHVSHGDIVLAAITSCTNTSNPKVMLAAGLLAKKAVERGLKVGPHVKTSMAPGSRVVTEYLNNAGLMPHLNALGFHLVGYGCSTCAGFSGPLAPNVEKAINELNVIAVGVLSGNRNFEGRIHPSIKANFLMSPPLVVAFALAGTVLIDVDQDAIGTGTDGKPVYLRDLWPSDQEVLDAMKHASSPEAYRRLYSDFAEGNPGVELWHALPSSSSAIYEWDRQSTYFKELPFYRGFSLKTGAPSNVRAARALGIYGDSITTDHINPVGAIPASSPAGQYLLENGVKVDDFNTYSSRRCNHEVQMRSIFANVRVRNLMAPGTEGSVTVHHPSGERLSIYDAAMRYRGENVPLIVFAGEEYGTGSSRDWAAKGMQLLGVKAVVANSFERIHRRNLVGMGVLPCQFKGDVSAKTLALNGSEVFDLLGLDAEIHPQQEVTLVITRADARREQLPLSLRLETEIEVEYFRHGGILPYVLRQLLAG